MATSRTVPASFLARQDNEQNTQAARRIAQGTYDPERDSTTPAVLRSEAEQRTIELRASMGMAPPSPGEMASIHDRDISRPVQDTSTRMVRTTGTKLGAPKIILPGSTSTQRFKAKSDGSGTRLGRPKITPSKD